MSLLLKVLVSQIFSSVGSSASLRSTSSPSDTGMQRQPLRAGFSRQRTESELGGRRHTKLTIRRLSLLFCTTQRRIKLLVRLRGFDFAVAPIICVAGLDVLVGSTTSAGSCAARLGGAL